MGEIAERSQWYKGKDPIMEAFSRERRGMLQTVAGRVDHAPGYLTDALTDLEIKTKRELSDLNYQIIAEAVERELAQQGLDYDLAYRTSTIEWEIEKAGLLDDLTRELTDSQKARDDRETVLANLAVEVGLRQIALINAKALLDQEMEQVRKEIAENQGATLPKEIELANARLATAQRKLDIIPHLYALLEAQEDLLSAEEVNIPLMESLVNERLAMIPIQEDLVGIKELLVDALNTLINPRLTVAEKKKSLAQVRLDYESRVRDKIPLAMDKVAALEDFNAAIQAHINKRQELVTPYMERATKMLELIAPRKEYAEALAGTIPYIVALATKRQELVDPYIERATKRLELIEPRNDHAEALMATIPYIVGLAEKRQELIEPYKERAVKMASLVSPRMEYAVALADTIPFVVDLATKRQELIAPYTEKAAKLFELISPRTDYAEALLATIPYIIELAGKRQELIQPSLDKADALRSLIAPTIEKANKTLEFAEATEEMTLIEQATKEIYHDIELLKKEGIEADLAVMAKRLEEGEYQQALVEANVLLRTMEAENRAALTSKEAIDSAAYLELRETGQTDVIEREKEASSIEIDTRFEVATKRIDSRLDSVRTTTAARVGHDGSIEKTARLHANAREDTAEANASAEITSRLIHSLS